MSRSVRAAAMLPAGLLLSLVGLPGCTKKADEPSGKVEAAPAPDAAVPAGRGLHPKVVPIKRDIVPGSTPGGPPAGGALSYFRPYFVQRAEPDLAAAAHYEVGDSPEQKSVRGWVRRADVFRWDTRLAVRCVGPVTVFPTCEAVLDVLRTGHTKEKALARTYGPGGGWMPFPVEESRKVRVNEGEVEVVKIHFLAAAGSPAPYTPDEKRRIYDEVVTLNLAFVCDGTASTTPFQTVIRSALGGIATTASGLGDRAKVSYGLTVYTDYVKAIMFREPDGTPTPTRVVPLAPGLKAFLDEVAKHKPATESSDDYAEAGYDGLLACLNQAWTGTGLSERAVVWISDNSSHEPGSPKNPRRISADQLIALAKKQNARVYALAIRGAGDEDQVAHMRQCRAIAEGTGGQFVELKDASDANAVAEKIVAVYRARLAEVDRRGGVVDGLAKNRPAADVKADLKLSDDQWTQVMDYLGQNGVDLARFSPAAPGVATGWAVTAVNGKPVLRPEVFLSRRELGFLITELNRLAVVLDDSNDRVNLLKLAVDTRVGYRSFFEREHGERMNVWYAKQNLPVSGGILNLTQEELVHMSEQRRRELKDKVRGEVIPRLTAFNSNNRSFVYFDKEEYAWLEESILP